MRLVNLISPEDLIDYAQRAMLDSIKHMEVPQVPHLLYNQVLEGSDKQERQRYDEMCNCIDVSMPSAVVYYDKGITSNMSKRIKFIKELGKPIEMRSIQ